MVTSWSDDETVALINAYRNKWYSLRRSNLRPPDWQEVTDAVAVRCPEILPPKTSDQCRHKMEELRRRYRAELQRIQNPNPNNNNKKKLLYKYFKLMDCLESGVDCSDPSVERMDPRMDRNSEDDNIPLLPLHSNGIKQSVPRPRPLLNKRAGVRIKVPNTVSDNDNDVSSLDIRRKYGSGGVYCGGVKRKGEGMEGSDGEVTREMMGAIKRLGDGFVKMERVKMDMAKELEIMRIKMERERMGIVIETQRKVCDVFVKTVSEKKKIKKMVAPET